MPSGINLVTGLPFDVNQYECEHNILDAEMKDLVLSEIPNKSAKHKAKKAAAANKGAGNTTTPATAPAAPVAAASPAKDNDAKVAN